MSDHRGKFVWYELMTTNMTAAETFYRGVVGWNAKEAGMNGMSYTLFSMGEASVAGLMTLPDAGRKPAWIGYVAVDDVDASAAQVEREGGKIHRAPDDIPGVGRFAVIADPQGTVLALFSSSGRENPPAAPRGTPGHGGWHELHAVDWQAAFGFYEKLFGWTKAEHFDMGPMGIYQIFANGGEQIGGMRTKPETVPAPFWLYYFNVENINDAAARVRAGGGQVLREPQEVPGGFWIIHCLDPQGALFALVAPPSK
jgi:uncharacterized protein